MHQNNQSYQFSFFNVPDIELRYVTIEDVEEVSQKIQR